MKRFLQISDEYTRVFDYRIRNSQLSLCIGALQLLVCIWSLTQHIYSLMTFKKILYCDFADNSTLPSMLTAVDAIIFDVGLFHALWGIHGCVAQHLDGGYGRFVWCCTHIIALCICLPFAFVRRPKPPFLWPMLIQQSTYGIGLLILSLAALPRVLPTLMGELSSAPLHAIFIYLLGTFMNFFLLYIYWHWYWHVEAQWESARKLRENLLQQSHNRRTGAITTTVNGCIDTVKAASLPVLKNNATNDTPTSETITIVKNNYISNGNVHVLNKNNDSGVLSSETSLNSTASNPPSIIEYWRNRQRQQQLQSQNGHLSTSRTAVSIQPSNINNQLPYMTLNTSSTNRIPFITTVLSNAGYCELPTKNNDTSTLIRQKITQSDATDENTSHSSKSSLIIRNNHFVEEESPKTAIDRSFVVSSNHINRTRSKLCGTRKSFRSATGSVPNEVMAMNPYVTPRSRRASMQREPFNVVNSTLRLPASDVDIVERSPFVVSLPQKQRHLMIQAIQNANALRYSSAVTSGNTGAPQAMSLKRLPNEMAPRERQISTSMSMSYFGKNNAQWLQTSANNKDLKSIYQSNNCQKSAHRSSIKLRRQSWRRNRTTNVRPSSMTPPESLQDLRKPTASTTTTTVSTPSPSGSAESTKNQRNKDVQLSQRVCRLKLEEAPRSQRRNDEGKKQSSLPASSSSGPVNVACVGFDNNSTGEINSATLRRLNEPSKYAEAYENGFTDTQLRHQCELKNWKQKVADSKSQNYDNRQNKSLSTIESDRCNVEGMNRQIFRMLSRHSTHQALFMTQPETDIIRLPLNDNQFIHKFDNLTVQHHKVFENHTP